MKKREREHTDCCFQLFDVDWWKWEDVQNLYSKIRLAIASYNNRMPRYHNESTNHNYSVKRTWLITISVIDIDLYRGVKLLIVLK